MTSPRPPSTMSVAPGRDAAAKALDTQDVGDAKGSDEDGGMRSLSASLGRKPGEAEAG